MLPIQRRAYIWKGAVGDVGVEGAELAGADRELDASGAELLLEDLGKETGGFVGAGLHLQVKADSSAVCGITGLLEESAGAGGVVGIMGEGCRECGGPVFRRE